VDLLLAQSSFDSLKPEARRRISELVKDLVAQHMAGDIDATDPDAVSRAPD